jgi:hypothetical protein
MRSQPALTLIRRGLCFRPTWDGELQSAVLQIGLNTRRIGIIPDGKVSRKSMARLSPCAKGAGVAGVGTTDPASIVRLPLRTLVLPVSYYVSSDSSIEEFLDI